MDEFLKLEYEQCLGLVKYYDERHQSLVKFCAGISSAVPSLLLAIFQLGNDVAMYFWKFTAVISIGTALGLLAIYTVMIQTRLYFIFPARQVNAIRKTALQAQSEFTNNQMYLDTKFSAFKWSSSQTLLNGFVALQIGVFINLFVFSIYFHAVNLACLSWLAIGIGLFVSLVIFGLSAWYLHSKSKLHPDVSVHGARSE
jgi:hypothetical protein